MPAAAPNPYFKPVIVGKSYHEIILADNPTSYWRLGESSGPTAVDELGLANHTYQGTPIYGVDGLINNESNTAVDFDGAGNTIGTSLGTLTLPYTIEAWVSIPAVQTDAFFPVIFGTHQHINNYYGLLIQFSTTNRTIHLQYGDGGGNDPADRKTWSTATTIPTDTPTHIVGVATDFNTAAIYFNGILQGTTTSGTGTSINYSNGVPVIGKNLNINGIIQAEFTIDEVAVWNGTALTAQQILNHYNAGS